MFNIDFWKSGSEDAFKNYHKELVEHGFSKKEAIEFLEGIYGVVSGEYGN